MEPTELFSKLLLKKLLLYDSAYFEALKFGTKQLDFLSWFTESGLINALNEEFFKLYLSNQQIEAIKNFITKGIHSFPSLSRFKDLSEKEILLQLLESKLHQKSINDSFNICKKFSSELIKFNIFIFKISDNFYVGKKNIPADFIKTHFYDNLEDLFQRHESIEQVLIVKSEFS